MVVLAASVVSKSGKALVSRQYMDMSRIRIEGLLAAFPKLVGSGKQHTYVETENVRYVYQPMEGIYLLLVTNKQSNILEDLDTLRLLAKLVPEYASSLEEEAICRNAFELVFAFDEVISLGIRDNVTIQQVKQNCEMESHEEKLHKMLIQSKINDTKDLMKRKAVEIEKTKMDNQKGAASGFMRSGGFGSAPQGMGGMGSSSDSTPAPAFTRPPMSTAPAKSTGTAPGKGMKLGSSKKNDLLETLAKEGELVSDRPAAAGGFASVDAAAPTEPVSLNVDEKLNVVLNKQGGVESVEIQGTLSLVVHADEYAFLRMALATGDNRAFQFKTHPNIDKLTYSSSNVLGLKDPSRPFPTGSELGVLKWFCKTKDEAFVPLTINCWPSVSGSQSYVNVEYESTATYDLQNVVIAIPVPSGQVPTVNQVDGDWRYDSRRGVVLWTIDMIDDANRSGAMEFVTPSSDSDSFFPIDITFSATKTFCDVEIQAVEQTQTQAPVKFSSTRLLQTVQYQVV